jgi:hypothetical protein
MTIGRLLFGLMCGSVLVWPAIGAQDAASVPDFTGMWGRNAFNFEPLPSGPVPLVNLKRVKDGTGDALQLVGDYMNPILKPEAADRVRQYGEISKLGRDYPDPSNSCGAWAPPFTFAMELGMQMLQKKDGITFLYAQDDQVRHVRLNASHPARLTPTPMGDSVGHYEGDTLVVDTVGIKTGVLGLVDRYGTPRSDAFHLVERYRLIDGAAAKEAQERHEKVDGRVGGRPGAMAIVPDTNIKGLQLQFTVEDPKTFTTPWSANVTYRRSSEEWQEQVCADDTGNYLNENSHPIPRADRPDF